MAATSSKTSKVFSYIRRGDPFWFSAKTNIIHFRFSSENRFVVVFAEASKKEHTTKMIQKTKTTRCKHFYFWWWWWWMVVFLSIQKQIKIIGLRYIYVKICKNGQRFRYRRYNWKYQPHLVHFILIFMNTLGKVSAIYLLFNIVYCSCSFSDGFSCFGWQINLNE